MEELDLVAVRTITDPNMAELVKNQLEAEGIRCMVEGEHQAGLSGVLPMRILVPAADLDRARELLGAEADDE